MLWLLVTIIAYFLFAITTLGDKYLLSGAPEPKVYSFYVGLLGGLILLLIPFVGFFIPGGYEIVFCLFTGAIYLIAIFSVFQGLEYFEASRIVPAIGGFLPIFSFLFIYIFSGGVEVMGIKEIIALIFLIIGSILISYDPKKKVPFKSLKISALAALFLSLMFVLSKYVYLMLPFWTGFIWIRIGVLLTALLFLFSKKVRKDIFYKKSTFNKKTSIIFVINQAFGAGGAMLQGWGIALAPLVFLPVINALQGVQYLFLFILTLVFFKIFKEKISRKIINQKLIAIGFIVVGLITLGIF